MQNCPKKSGFTMGALAAILLLCPIPGRADSQRQSYQDGADAAKKAKTAETIGIGIWGAMAGICGVNCMQYLMDLRADRAAAKAAGTQLVTDTKAALGCGAVAAAPLVEAIYPKFLSNLLRAEKEAGVASATQAAAPEAAMASGVSKDAGPDEGAAVDLHLMGSKGEAVAAETAAHAAKPGFQACAGIAAKVKQSAAAAYAAATKLQATAKRVTTLGNVCVYGGVAAAAADIGLSTMITGKVGNSLYSLAGAAPGGFFILKGMMEKNAASNAVEAANAKGIGSCVTAAVSVGLVALKVVGRNNADKNQKENQRKADALNTALLEIDPAELGQWFAVFGWNLFVSEAQAAASVDPCVGSLKTSFERMDCAMAHDPAMRNVFGNGRANTIFSAVQQEFGADADVFMNPDRPLEPGQIAAMIAKTQPQLEGSIRSIIDTAISDVFQALGSGTLLASAGQPTVGNVSSAAAAERVASSPNGVAATMGARAPASFALDNLAANADGIVDSPQANLFQIVSRKYEKITRAEFSEQAWVTPFNKLSNSR